MQHSSLTVRRLNGVAGVAGALLFFTGDMLFYGRPGPGGTFHDLMLQVVRSASVTRIFVGGLIGPPAACLCIIGFAHVRDNVAPKSSFFARGIFLSGAAMMVAGSALHALWVPRGLSFRYTAPPADSELLSALRDYWQAAYYVAAVPAYVCSALLLVAVLSGKSLYPRWTAATNFGVLSLLAPIAGIVPAPLGSILVGGFTNLSIATFFFVSLLSTWRASGMTRPELKAGGF
jgi:hypothetical protein